MLHLLTRLFARKPLTPVAEAVPAYFVPERHLRGSARRLGVLEQMFGYFGTR